MMLALDGIDVVPSLSDSALYLRSAPRLPHVVVLLKNQPAPFDQAKETNWQGLGIDEGIDDSN
jgi:hypothetical protein